MQSVSGLLLLAALAGCGAPQPLLPPLDLSGLTEAEATRRLGQPDGVDPGPPRVLIWTNVDATWVPYGYGYGYGRIAAFRCTVTAFVEGGRIAAYARHGNGC